MRCPICSRSLGDSPEAETRCSRCGAVVRTAGGTAALVSLGRKPEALTIQQDPAISQSYRQASRAAPFVVSKPWRNTRLILPAIQWVALLGAIGWLLSQRAQGLMETLMHGAAAAMGALALFAAWYLLAFAANRSTLAVSPDELRLTTGPIPWPWRRGRTLPASDLRAVRAVAVQREIVDGSTAIRRAGGTAMATRWWNLVVGEPELPILRRLSREEAHYLAERIRRTLGVA